MFFRNPLQIKIMSIPLLPLTFAMNDFSFSVDEKSEFINENAKNIKVLSRIMVVSANTVFQTL